MNVIKFSVADIDRTIGLAATDGDRFALRRAIAVCAARANVPAVRVMAAYLARQFRSLFATGDFVGIVPTEDEIAGWQDAPRVDRLIVNVSRLVQMTATTDTDRSPRATPSVH